MEQQFQKRDDYGVIWIVFVGSGLCFLSLLGLNLLIIMKERKNTLKAPAFIQILPLLISNFIYSTQTFLLAFIFIVSDKKTLVYKQDYLCYQTFIIDFISLVSSFLNIFFFILQLYLKLIKNSDRNLRVRYTALVSFLIPLLVAIIYCVLDTPSPQPPLEQILCSYNNEAQFIITYIFWVGVLFFMIFVSYQTYQKFKEFQRVFLKLNTRDIRTIKKTVTFLYFYPCLFLICYLPIIICKIIKIYNVDQLNSIDEYIVIVALDFTYLNGFINAILYLQLYLSKTKIINDNSIIISSISEYENPQYKSSMAFSKSLMSFLSISIANETHNDLQ